jgi:hypothetical protein
MSHKRITYSETDTFKIFHKFLNILALSCKNAVHTSSPHYLKNCQYNLKSKNNINIIIIIIIIILSIVSLWRVWGCHGSDYEVYGLLQVEHLIV